ncbi:V-type proton ATPase subunit G3-like [Cucurbita maxima]|uniref:V-type proton ATPase subunit G n=1 Tax=Cucurbita maxima TaxID=3661 RepID=A0A6J1KBY9_CUCMA|nr:V-type proton ATPase subunit G3-like [Cucurbita maxima]XP_022997599.1 V-type proton ATPase subunit G3-like [Cucurbita maxima]
MESFRGQGGIQMLLSAEQDAQQVISTARNMKMARLKQAKDEAEREVAQYRAHMEAQYQNKLSQTNSGSYMQRLEDETKVKIQTLKESSERVSKDVVHMLLQHVASPRI